MDIRHVIYAALLLPLAATAGPAWQQLSESGRRATSPEIAVGPDGAIVAVWLDRGLTADRPAPKPRKPGEHSHRSSTDLYLTRSTDGGRSWSKPVRVNDEPGSVWGFAVSKPRVAIGKTGTIHLFFPGNERSAVTGLDVVTARYTRSTDNGRTFEKARTINRPPDFDQTELLGEGLSATFSFGTMGVSPDGTIVTAWQDIGDMKNTADGADAHVAVSNDDGKTFTPERAAIATNAVCPCCQLTVAFDAGETFIGYRKLYADGRDSTVAVLDGDARALRGESRLPFAAWKIDGCPLKPTELAIDGDMMYAASYTAGEDPAGVYFTRSVDRGRSFSGRLPVHPGAPYSDAHELTVDGGGMVRIDWHAQLDGPSRLFTEVSADRGATLSAPLEIETPTGNSAYPATAVAPDGSVFVVGGQENEEVFVARLEPGPAATARN